METTHSGSKTFSLAESDGFFQEAVIVAAHPDDEILWFSSIIAKVRQIVVCYLGQPSQPDRTAGRIRVLAEYPLANVLPLGLDLAEVFNCGDWQHPKSNQYGMKLRCERARQQRYQANYHTLVNRLQDLLAPCSHVFTHNPWGEYGHEEHVQVFRAVETLRQRMGFTLWVSNYASERSLPFMLNSFTRVGKNAFTLPTEPALATDILDLYQKFGCWTWYPNFLWPHYETFLDVRPQNEAVRDPGRIFPMNMLDLDGAIPQSVIFKFSDYIPFLRTRASKAGWSDMA